jgi:large-conductance mechanosensitive channel
MRKRLFIALSIIAFLIIGFIIFFYAATATKKQNPVEINAPATSVK